MKIMATAAGDNMLNISVGELSNAQLSEALRQLCAEFGPITPSTRSVYERKLAKLRLGVSGHTLSGSASNGSPNRSSQLSTRTGGSVTAAVNDVQRKLLADQSVKARGRHAGNESHQINEEVLSVEDDDDDDDIPLNPKVSYRFSLPDQGVMVAETTSSKKPVASSVGLQLNDSDTAEILKKKKGVETSARRSVPAAAEVRRGERKLDQSGNQTEDLDSSRDEYEEYQVMKNSRKGNHVSKEAGGTNGVGKFDDGVRYRGTEDHEGTRHATNESGGAWKRDVGENSATPGMNGKSASGEKDRFGTEHYDSFSSSFFSTSLTRPSLDSLTRPPLHPESKKSHESDSNDEDFTMLSSHELSKALHQSNLETDAAVTGAGIPFLFKVIIPVAFIVLIVCIISYLDPEFANPVKL